MKTLTPGFYHAIIKGVPECVYFNGNAFAIVGCTKGYLFEYLDHVGSKIYPEKTPLIKAA